MKWTIERYNFTETGGIHAEADILWGMARKTQAFDSAELDKM